MGSMTRTEKENREMNKTDKKVDWGKELQELVSLAKTEEDRKAAFAFANAINPYLEQPELLKTLLGKIMQSPTMALAVVAAEREFDSIAQLREKTGKSVNVIPL